MLKQNIQGKYATARVRWATCQDGLHGGLITEALVAHRRADARVGTTRGEGGMSTKGCLGKLHKVRTNYVKSTYAATPIELGVPPSSPLLAGLERCHVCAPLKRQNRIESSVWLKLVDVDNGSTRRGAASPSLLSARASVRGDCVRCRKFLREVDSWIPSKFQLAETRHPVQTLWLLAQLHLCSWWTLPGEALL